MNPRYVAYANAHGMTVEARMEADRAEYPGGRNAGFFVWNSQQLRAWKAETKWSRDRWAALSPADHVAYDAWLAARFPAFSQQEAA